MSEKDEGPTLRIYSDGITHCSVCTNAPRERVAELTNAQNPTQISSPWEVSYSDFGSGDPNPTPCEDREGFMHYLMVC